MCHAHEEMKRIAALEAVKAENLSIAAKMISDGFSNEDVMWYLSHISNAELEKIRKKHSSSLGAEMEAVVFSD